MGSGGFAHATLACLAAPLHPCYMCARNANGVVMPKTLNKKIVRREYTKTDVKELRAHSRAKTPVTKIAKLTNRTVGSLRQKALKLGIPLGHRR